MEGASGETKTPSASSQGRSKIEEKLAMTSPNNSRTMIESQLLLTSPRPRRPKNSKYIRRRSFDSIDLSGLLLQSNSEDNLNNYGNDEKGMMSPSNSNHSFSRCDTQRSFTSPRSLTRLNRSKKSSKFPHPRSFDSLDLSALLTQRSNSDHRAKSSENSNDLKWDSNPSFHRSDHQESTKNPRRRRQKKNYHQRISDMAVFPQYLVPQFGKGDEDHSNEKDIIGEKLGMTSLNNNLNNTDHQIFTSSRQKVRSGRQRVRRRSCSAELYADPPLASVENGNDGKLDDNEKEDVEATPSNRSAQRRTPRQNGGARSLPSNSGHSGYSVWTEMTIHTDTCLQSNQEDSDSSSATSAYYSDGGLPFETYEPNSSYSMKVNGLEDDDDDDSSDTNFNYKARDNGSLQTLASAFSLNELGSTGTISSLSVDGDESDSNYAETPDKLIQFIISPSRQVQRQQRRASNHSFGRRRRRNSNDGSFASFSSRVKSGDELTEEEITVEGIIPNLPNLPNRVSARDLLLKSSYSGSGDDLVGNADDVEEVTVDGVQTDEEEYIEELLHDTSENYDDSTKRYEILISDDSFVEEIVVEVEEEEITVEENDLNDRDIEDTESIAGSRSYGDNASPNIDENSSCHSNDENLEGASNIYIQSLPNDESRNDLLGANNKSDDDVDQCSNGDYKTPENVDYESECNVDHNHVENDAISPVHENTGCIVDSQSNEDNQDTPPSIEEELDSSKDCQNDNPDREPPTDRNPENCTDVPPTTNCNSVNSYNGEDDQRPPAKSYRDILMDAKA